jgi:DnaJ-class molecular chaperone
MDIRTVRVHKSICPSCNGNGYRMIYKDASWQEKVPIDCAHCNNQGELSVEEPTIAQCEEYLKDQ